MLHIGDLLAASARRRPTHTAVVFGDTRLDFAGCLDRAQRAAALLQELGLVPGDRLGLLLGNSLELLDLYRAAALIGVVAVPLSTLLAAPGVVKLLADAGVAAVVADAALARVTSAAREQLPASIRWLTVGAGGGGPEDYAARCAAADPAALAIPPLDEAAACHLMYSSGTTGTPKGIVLSQRTRALYALLFAGQFRIDADSVVMHSGSLVFNGAMVTLLPAWLAGCTYVLEHHFDAATVIARIGRERVSHLMLVPSQIAALLNHPDWPDARLDSVRMVCSVGAPLPLEHKRRLAERLPGAVYELYGLTEGFVTVLDARDLAARPDSVGLPVAFSTLRIVDPAGRDLPPGEIGEIVGNGPLLMDGYLGQPDKTAEVMRDGWLHSGDLGRVDAEGYLYLVDRAKDLIISGGVNVYPRDIEEVAARHPAVAEVAVFGAPDPAWGETPIAAVSLRSGMTVAAADLRDWINANIAARFQRVREVVIVATMPRNVAGKTLKRELREHYLQP